MVDQGTGPARRAGTPLRRIGDYVTAPAAPPPSRSWHPLAAIGAVLLLPKIAEWLVPRLGRWLAVIVPVGILPPDLASSLGPRATASLEATSESCLEILLLLAVVRIWSGNVATTLCLAAPRVAIGQLAFVAAIVFVAWIPLSALGNMLLEANSFRGSGGGGREAATHWLVVLLGSVLVVPFSEELYYRAFLFPALAVTRLGFLGAAIVSSALWAAEHTHYSWPTLLELFLGGIVACWAVRKTGSIWAVFLAHAAWNADASWQLTARLVGE